VKFSVAFTITRISLNFEPPVFENEARYPNSQNNVQWCDDYPRSSQSLMKLGPCTPENRLSKVSYPVKLDGKFFLLPSYLSGPTCMRMLMLCRCCHWLYKQFTVACSEMGSTNHHSDLQTYTSNISRCSLPISEFSYQLSHHIVLFVHYQPLATPLLIISIYCHNQFFVFWGSVLYIYTVLPVTKNLVTIGYKG